MRRPAPHEGAARFRHSGITCSLCGEVPAFSPGSCQSNLRHHRCLRDISVNVEQLVPPLRFRASEMLVPCPLQKRKVSKWTATACLFTDHFKTGPN